MQFVAFMLPLSFSNLPLMALSYLASHSMRTELPKAKWRLNPPEQCHHIKVFDPSPKEEHTIRDQLLQKDLLVHLDTT